MMPRDVCLRYNSPPSDPIEDCSDEEVAASALESSVPSRLTRLEGLVAHLSLQMQTLSTSDQASCNVTQADSQASGTELGNFALRLQRMEDFLSSLAASLAAMPPLDEL
ncbi:hypothetical protein AK812_SmicGene48178 [Symbiodinium microadriaticum]|uniref:Uncharacterized protein n=1 Tax=Symbiodinium microadriaticum TaxID=2951 RepID=A0A1Q9BQG6_SYMMI|nr:hypothetical protein AK812_SmicGene48178 [Symbiodinium microadriaticum]